MFVAVGGDPVLVKYTFEDKDRNMAYCNFTISAVRKCIILYCLPIKDESQKRVALRCYFSKILHNFQKLKDWYRYNIIDLAHRNIVQSQFYQTC